MLLLNSGKKFQISSLRAQRGNLFPLLVMRLLLPIIIGIAMTQKFSFLAALTINILNLFEDCKSSSEDMAFNNEKYFNFTLGEIIDRLSFI